MRFFVLNISRLTFAVALITITGCGAGPLYVQTFGKAGPLQWQAIDLEPGRRTVEGKEVDVYDFTLVLRETRGIGLTFTNISSTIYGGGWVGWGRNSRQLNLPAYCELRLPFSVTGFKSPLWVVTLAGKDEHGQPLRIVITVALPPDPKRGAEEQAQFVETFQHHEGGSDRQPSTSVASISQLSSEERRRIRVESISFDPTDISKLLQFDSNRSLVPTSGVTTIFESRIPLTAQSGLNRIAGWLASGLLPTSTTTTVPLDSAYRQNLPQALRFTHIEDKKEPNSCSQQVLVESADDFVDFSSQTETATFDRHGFTLNEWSNDERMALSGVLRGIPETWLTSVRGLTFQRGAGDPKNPEVAGYYNPIAHTVTMYDGAFRPLKFGFVGADKTAGAIAHELGHGIDFAPLRKVAERMRRAVVSFEKAFPDYLKAGFDQQMIPPDRQKDWEERGLELMALEKEMREVRSISGSRWHYVTESRRWDIVDAEESAGAFRNAAALDGSVRITEYAEKSWGEHFAECFSLYVTDPRLLKLLRPNIYSYFAKQYPR